MPPINEKRNDQREKGQDEKPADNGKGPQASKPVEAYTGQKARGDAAEGKDDPNTENEGDYGPGSD